MKHRRNYAEITNGITGYVVTSRTSTRKKYSIVYFPTLEKAMAFAERLKSEFGLDIVENYEVQNE